MTKAKKAAEAAVAAAGVTVVSTTVKSEIEKAQTQKRKAGMEIARKKAAEANLAKKQRQAVKLTAHGATMVEH